MDPEAIRRYFTDMFADVTASEDAANPGNFFFSYEPTERVAPDRGFLPFTTLVTSDAYDQVSQLDRPAVFRLNIGVSPETYRAWFGPHPCPLGESGMVATGHDFAALDQVMPHPVYAGMSWVCVLSPSANTFETVVRPLLAEAYQRAVRRHEAQANRRKDAKGR